MFWKEPRFQGKKHYQNYECYCIQKHIKGTLLECSVKYSLSIDSCGRSKKGQILLDLQYHSSDYGLRISVGDNQKHLEFY